MVLMKGKHLLWKKKPLQYWGTVQIVTINYEICNFESWLKSGLNNKFVVRAWILWPASWQKLILNVTKFPDTVSKVLSVRQVWHRSCNVKQFISVAVLHIFGAVPIYLIFTTCTGKIMSVKSNSNFVKCVCSDYKCIKFIWRSRLQPCSALHQYMYLCFQLLSIISRQFRKQFLPDYKICDTLYSLTFL